LTAVVLLMWQGYLRALGMSRTAQVKRDARMGEAEAHRDAGIRVSPPVSIAVTVSVHNMVSVC